MPEESVLPICAGEREYLEKSFHGPALLALWYFRDGQELNGQVSDRSLRAHKHIQACTACREWFHSQVPQELLTRQSRLARYCCASMYCAVEEHAEHRTNNFEFTMFRGEDPCWMIDGAYSFASYCPWCGTKLPGQPFISQ